MNGQTGKISQNRKAYHFIKLQFLFEITVSAPTRTNKEILTQGKPSINSAQYRYQVGKYASSNQCGCLFATLRSFFFFGDKLFEIDCFARFGHEQPFISIMIYLALKSFFCPLSTRRLF